MFRLRAKIQLKIFLLLYFIIISSPHFGWCSKIKLQLNLVISHIISGLKLRISCFFLGLMQSSKGQHKFSVSRGGMTTSWSWAILVLRWSPARDATSPIEPQPYALPSWQSPQVWWFLYAIPVSSAWAAFMQALEFFPCKLTSISHSGWNFRSSSLPLWIQGKLKVFLYAPLMPRHHIPALCLRHLGNMEAFPMKLTISPGITGNEAEAWIPKG